MEILKGGHAIMFKVSVPPDISDCAAGWVAADAATRQSKLDKAHVTLLFVGRDLTVEQSEAVLEASRHIANLAPKSLFTKGPLAMFGAKRDHLVAMIEKTGVLLDLRRRTEDYLGRAGVKFKKDFSFNPHLTLALGAPGSPLPDTRPSGRALDVLGVEAKLGSDRMDFAPVPW